MTGVDVAWLIVGWIAGILTVALALWVVWSKIPTAVDDPDGGPGAPGYHHARLPDEPWTP